MTSHNNKNLAVSNDGRISALCHPARVEAEIVLSSLLRALPRAQTLLYNHPVVLYGSQSRALLSAQGASYYQAAYNSWRGKKGKIYYIIVF